MRKFMLVGSVLLGLAPAAAGAAAIHDAAKAGDVRAIAAALDAGADVNAYEGMGTPLSYAVKRGHLAAAELLIARGATVNTPTRYSGDPLIMAVLKRRLDLMSLLLAHRAHPDTTHEGETALHIATWLGCLGCVEILVRAGADVNAQNFGPLEDCKGKRTPLDIATSYGYADIAGYLKVHGAKLTELQ
jgi:cytochrome c